MEHGSAENSQIEQGAKEIIRKQKENVKGSMEQREMKKEQWKLLKTASLFI